MKLWIATRAATRRAWVLSEYSGAVVRIANRFFSTPKILSTTFRAWAWCKLKSSSAFCGLDTSQHRIGTQSCGIRTPHHIFPIPSGGIALLDKGQAVRHRLENLHQQGNTCPLGSSNPCCEHLHRYDCLQHCLPSLEDNTQKTYPWSM